MAAAAAACCLLLTHVWTREKDKASRGSVPAAQTNGMLRWHAGATSSVASAPPPPTPALSHQLAPRP